MSSEATVQIDGREVTLSVDLESGQWSAYYDYQRLASAATRDLVVKKARAALRCKQVRLAIPATLVDVEGKAKPLHVSITGLHSQNGDVLYEVANRKDKGRLSTSSWRRQLELCPRLTDDEVTAFVTLRNAAQDAEAAFERWRRQHVIADSERFVKDAIEKQVKTDGGEEISS